MALTGSYVNIAQAKLSLPERKLASINALPGQSWICSNRKLSVRREKNNEMLVWRCPSLFADAVDITGQIQGIGKVGYTFFFPWQFIVIYLFGLVLQPQNYVCKTTGSSSFPASCAAVSALQRPRCKPNLQQGIWRSQSLEGSQSSVLLHILS